MNTAIFPNAHPAAMQHSGMVHGQPGAPGQVPHPQAMGHAMMQQGGVSAPGGPHVTQGGPMMGMQPGMGQGGPNAHAMSHLTPGGQMVQQQSMQCKSFHSSAQHIPFLRIFFCHTTNRR
jgi:hypothetical protein